MDIFLTSPGNIVLIIAAGFILVALIILFFSKPDSDVLVIELKELGLEKGYMTQKESEQIVSLKDLSRFWRQPVSYFNPDYEPRLNNRAAQEFFNEMIHNSPWFSEKKVLQRALICQILEKFDKEYSAPSVRRLPSNIKDTDVDWDKTSYAILSQVTLLDHTLHSGEMLIAHLKERKETWLIPNALLAVLAHDLGKLPSLKEGEGYSTGAHPLRSTEVLNGLLAFEKLPRKEEVLNAVLCHHDKGPIEGLASLVQYADRAARKQEFQAYSDVHEIPSWIAPVDLPRNVGKGTGVLQIREENLEEFPFSDQEIPGVDVELEYIPTETGETRPPAEPETNSQPDDQQYPTSDDKWPAAVQLAKDRESLDLKMMCDELRIGKKRGEVILRGLQEAGLIEQSTREKPEGKQTEDELEGKGRTVPVVPPVKQSVEEIDSLPEGPNPDDNELLATIEESNVMATDMDPCPDNHGPVTKGEDLTGEEFGTRTVFSEEQQSQNERITSSSAKKGNLDISKWFRPDAFLLELKKRLDRDLTSAGRKIIFQGISSPDQGIAWFNIQALKDIAAHQIRKYEKDSGMAARMVSPEAEYRDEQNMVLAAIVAYFKKVKLIRSSYLTENNYSMLVDIHTAAGCNRQKRFIPFVLYDEFYTNPEEAKGRKVANPIAGSVQKIEVSKPE